MAKTAWPKRPGQNSHGQNVLPPVKSQDCEVKGYRHKPLEAYVDATYIFVNSLPNDKILDRSKLKALADDKINVIEKLKFLGKVENIEGKGENAGYQHFLLFPQCF